MIDKSKNLSIEMALSWNDEQVSYVDRYFMPKTNFWRDIYPPVLDYQLKRAELHQIIQINYGPGELLLEQYSKHNLKTIPTSKFNKSHWDSYTPIQPAIGRFYPRGLIDGVAGCYKEDTQTFRLLDKTDETLAIDLNHPLATFPLQLTVTIDDIFDATQQNGGRCQDIAEIVTDDGPGLQNLLTSRGSDFFSSSPFSRLNETDDEEFYAQNNSSDPVDLKASEELQKFYGRYLQDGMLVVDLMAGKNSHLPINNKLKTTAIGLNETELKNNSALTSYHIHDLNKQPKLPLENHQFDAVVCSFAVEYITQPFEIFTEVARILKPDGTFLISFSDRFEHQKVISLWENVHVFERMGIILEYFRHSGLFTDLHCESIRGKIRHEDDDFIAKNIYSCPLFMLKGTKIS